jgi:hypothetical protein
MTEDGPFSETASVWFYYAAIAATFLTSVSPFLCQNVTNIVFLGYFLSIAYML